MIDLFIVIGGIIMEWKGANALLLNEYFENKEKLFELKKKKEYLDYRGEDISNHD